MPPAPPMTDFDQPLHPADLESPIAAAAGFLAEARRITVGEALRAIPDTVAIMLRGFWFYCGMAAAMIGIYAVAAAMFDLLFGRIPVLGLLMQQIVLPAAVSLLFYGWYRVIGERETSGTSRFVRLFSGFLEDPLRIAAGVLLVWVATTLVFGLVFFLAALLIAPGVLHPGGASMSTAKIGFAAGLGMFALSILLAPLMSIQGLFLAATAVGRLPVLAALRAAALAVLRNWLPVMAVCAVLMGVAMVVALLLGVVIGGIGGLLRSVRAAMLLALPAVVIGVALLPAFGYALFHRLFFPPPEHEAAAAQPARVLAPELPPEAYAAPPVGRDAPWTLAILRALGPVRFGALCSAYFQAAGFHVEPRHGLADGSARFALAAAATPGQPLMLVESVAWGAAADLPRIRNFKDALARSSLARGIVVAASGFLEDTLQDAAASRLRAIDGAELLTLILKLAPEKQQALRDAAFPPT